MRSRILLLILLFPFFIFADEVIHINWSNVKPFSFNSATNIHKIRLNSWQMQLDAQNPQKVLAPILVKGVNTLSFKTSVKLPQNLPKETTVFFKISGLRGVCSFYANGHLLSLLPGTNNPLRIKIPNEVFNRDSVLELKLNLKQIQSPELGFPTIVYTLSEERYLGFSSIPELILESLPRIEFGNFTVSRQEKQFLLHYQYRIFYPQNVQSIRAEEDFYQQNEETPFFRKIRFSRDLTTGELNLMGTIPIRPERLWSPENPQKLRIELLLELTGETGKKQYKFKHAFGLRHISLNKQKFLLNFQPLQIRGMVFHFSPKTFANKDYQQQLKQMLSFIKKHHFNAIRLLHFLPDELFLSLADSLGLLVFGELPIWRYPAEFFNENFLLESGKYIIQQIQPFYTRHPSLIALGLGQEIPLYQPNVQKFMFILNSKIKTKLNLLTYISPLPQFPLPPERVADFYVYDRFRPVNYLQNSQNLRAFALIGKIGLLTPNLLNALVYNSTNPLNRGVLIKNEIYRATKMIQPNGGFVECLMDWFTEYPSEFMFISQNKKLIPHGFFNIKGKPKAWVKLLENPWVIDDDTLFEPFSENQMQTNFFSILMTFSALLFFAIFRRSPRLKENFHRSLRHAYGFFVDMRERRIIPFFNSIAINIFIALIMAVFLAAQIYYYHNSLWLQEIVSIFLIPLNIFEAYLKWSQSKLLITIILFTFFLTIPFLGATILKIIAWFNRSKIRFRQGYAIINWAAVPMVWFFPISLVTYHYMYYGQPLKWLWVVFALLFLWIQLRTINGIHILFLTRPLRVLIILLLCYFIPVLIFWVLFNPPVYWVNYLQLMIEAKSLF